MRSSALRLGLMAAGLMAGCLARPLIDTEDYRVEREHDAHVLDWHRHKGYLAYLARKEQKRLEQLERDRPIIEAAEAKRKRKAEKLARIFSK